MGSGGCYLAKSVFFFKRSGTLGSLGMQYHVCLQSFLPWLFLIMQIHLKGILSWLLYVFSHSIFWHAHMHFDTTVIILCILLWMPHNTMSSLGLKQQKWHVSWVGLLTQMSGYNTHTHTPLCGIWDKTVIVLKCIFWLFFKNKTKQIRTIQLGFWKILLSITLSYLSHVKHNLSKGREKSHNGILWWE